MNHNELDGFLNRHAVFLDYSIEDYERELEIGERFWQKGQAELDAKGESQK